MHKTQCRFAASKKTGAISAVLLLNILEEMEMELREFFVENKEAAVAFSGGVDSAYLLSQAVKYAVRVKAYYVKGCFQPEFELEDARRLAEELGAEMEVIELGDTVLDEKVSSNPPDRCYYCKKKIMGAIKEAAAKDGFDTVLDGTNASDDAGERPGMRALGEMKILSPLRICGLTKDEIRRLSREEGLFTWDKPAYACLATRIPTGIVISSEILSRIEEAETALMSMGFSDFRVRVFGGGARLQLKEHQMAEALKKRQDILKALKPFFNEILLDMEAR